MKIIKGFLGFLLSSVNCQEGYEYGPPPVETQLKPRPRPQPVEAEGFGASKPQPSGGGGGGHSHGDSDDPLAWLRESVPGEPDVDYPILSTAPETSFSCADKADGMYADVEARCQAWHQCLGDRSWAFLCPNGTIFNQQIFTCVWWFDFDCQEAEGFYGLNEGLYESEGGEGGGDYGGASGGTAGALPNTGGGGGVSPGSSGGSGGRPGSGGSGGRPGSGGSGGRPGSGGSGGRPGSGGSSGGGSSRPSVGRPSGSSRPSGGSSRPSGGRPTGGGTKPGLVLVLPVLGEEEEEDNLAGYQPDTLYGAPGGRSGRRSDNFGGIFDY